MTQLSKNKTAYQLLEILADGRFHSGQGLGSALGITRSGIWKAMKQLQKVGVEIHAVTGKGYRIPYPIELFNETLIFTELNAERKLTLNELQIHTCLDSTNDFLLTAINESQKKIIACLTEHQSAGRGRSGKKWVSNFASGICLSLMWHFNKDPSEIIGLSLSVAVAIVTALQRYGIQDGLELKWPNDILYQGKKLAGILIDMVAEPHGQCSVVIGIGLNVQSPFKFDTQINQPWTDLSKITQHPPERNKITGLILDELIAMLQHFDQLGLAPFLEKWQSLNTMQGKKVRLFTASNEIHGTMLGVSARGELVLRTEQNQIKHFLSGEVSLRLDSDSS